MNSFSDKIVELYPWLRMKANKFCKVRDDADDLVSETVLRLLQNRDKYNGESDLKPWCLVIMKNIFCNWYQRKVSVPFVELDDTFHVFVTDGTDYEEMLNILMEYSLLSLNVHCVDLYIQGYSYEEISVMLNIKIGTVRSRIFNGRKLLKCALEL